jgi:hypothetical protein
MVDNVHACYSDTQSFITCRRENLTLDPTLSQSDLDLNFTLIVAFPARIAMGRPNMSFVVFLDSCRLVIGWYIQID